MEINADMNSSSTELTFELAASSSLNLLPGYSSLLFTLRRRSWCIPERV